MHLTASPRYLLVYMFVYHYRQSSQLNGFRDHFHILAVTQSLAYKAYRVDGGRDGRLNTSVAMET